MAYKYENVELPPSPGYCFHFSLEKIKKLYPLHIITMLFAIVLTAAKIIHYGARLRSFILLGGKILLNVTLLQTWVPDCRINASLNGVAWFLSATLFLYFLFPWMKRIIERTPIVRLCLICGMILAAETAACIPFIMFFGSNSPTYVWFMYFFPVFRIGDFFVGSVLKRVFFELNLIHISRMKAVLLDASAAAMTFLVYYWHNQDHSHTLLLAIHNRTTLFVPTAAVWVLLFAANKGWLTKMLSNPLSLRIGNLSAYAFLIHFVVTQYISHLLSYKNIVVVGWKRVPLVSAELAVTILLSVLYKHFHEKYEKYVTDRFGGRKKETVIR